MVKLKKTIFSTMLCIVMVLCLTLGVLLTIPTKSYAETIDYTKYYLCGYINGESSGVDEDFNSCHEEYRFDNQGKLTVTFTSVSYVIVKSNDNAHWFSLESYQDNGNAVTIRESYIEKMFAPANVEITFTLVDNSNGTLTLSYVTSAKMTVADVIATVKGGFPTSSEGPAPSDSWVNDNKQAMFCYDSDYYISGDGDFILLADTSLTKDGNNYKCTKDDVTFTFNMSDNVLVSVEVQGSVDYAKMNGIFKSPITQDSTDTKPEGSKWLVNEGNNHIWYQLTDSDTVLTIAGEGEMPDFTVVDRVCDAPWSSAEDTITSIEIGSGVKRIGTFAFYSLKNVTSVVIPEGVEVIGDKAFASCVGLTSVTIPSSLKSIEADAFTFCDKVSELHIPDIESWFNISVEDGTDLPFGSSMVTGKKLYIGASDTPTTEIVIPQGITSIPDYAFFRVDGITKVTIPSSVTSIGDSAFYGCTGLTEITIPNSVTSIGDSAFDGCKGLTKITIPSSVASIGNQAFYGCTELTSVIMEAGVKSIGNNSFSGCSKLTEITLPNTVTSIGAQAFQRCSGLTSVTIPNSVTSIGGSAFDQCRNLNELHIGDIGSWCKISFANTDSNPFGEKATGRKVYVGKSDTPTTEIVIPEGVETINQYAFYSFDSITSVTIPSSVTSIGSDAFSGCTNINELHIGDIGRWCNIPFVSSGSNPFNGGAKDKKVYIGKSDTPTTEIVIPEGVETVNDYAFYNFDNITSVTIPSSVTSIGINAFYKCAELTSVTIPSSVTSIGNQAFQSCSGLTSVTIPSSVTSIGNSAFYRCAKLKEITIPDSVTSIGSSVFSGCAELTSVTIPSSVTSIGSQAFYNCAKLNEITIPDSVTSIGGNAFNGCTGLNVLVMKSGIPATIDKTSFKNAPLTTIYVPNGKTEAYSSAENWSALTGVTFKDAYIVNAGDMENGKVSYDKDYFPTESFNSADKTVTIMVTPDSGYHLKSLTVKSATSMARPIIPEQDTEDKTKYTFTMPTYSVIVMAEFEEISLYLPELDAKVKALEELLGVDGSALKDLINQAITAEFEEGGSIDTAIQGAIDEITQVIDELNKQLEDLNKQVESDKDALDIEDKSLSDLIQANDDAIKLALDQAKIDLNNRIDDTIKELKEADSKTLEDLTKAFDDINNFVQFEVVDLEKQIAANKETIDKIIKDIADLDKKTEVYKTELDKEDKSLSDLIQANDDAIKLALDQAKIDLNNRIDDTIKELKNADIKDLVDLTNMINKLSGELTAATAFFDKKVAENKEAIEKVAAKLADLDKKTEGYKTTLDKEDVRLSNLIQSNDDAMKLALKEAKDELNKLIEDTKEELKSADAKNLDDLTNIINDLSKELKIKDAELKRKIDDNKEAIEKVAKDLETLDGKVEGYKTSLEIEDVRLEGLINANDEAIKGALEKAKEDLNKLIEDTTKDLQSADANNLEDLTNVINNLSKDLKAKDTNLEIQIDANKAAMEKVAKDLEEFVKVVEGYKKAFDTEDERLAELIKSNDDTMKASLEKAKEDLNKLIEDTTKDLQLADANSLEELTTKIENLSKDLKAKDTNLETQIAANKAAIESVAEKVTKDLADLENKLANKDKQIEENISTFVMTAIIAGSIFFISNVVLFVIVLKKKRA